MKLFNKEEDGMYLSRKQWTKLFLAFSIMTIILYLAAMIASLCGSKYFILNYQNSQMDMIESWLREHQIYPLAMLAFNAIEFSIILSFIHKKFAKWYYIVCFCACCIAVSIAVPTTPAIFYQLLPFIFYIFSPIIEQILENRKTVPSEKFSWKKYLFCEVRLLVAMLVVFVLQIMIFIIKAGYLTFESIIMNLSATFIYALEYDIALAVILFTILLVYREKGVSKLWATFQAAGSSSQISTTKSQKSTQKKNLTKAQRSKIRFLYLKFYLTQTGAFLFLMVVPFLLGKVLEFLVMYLSFAIVRFILGFKYSLHYKKETTCITVGVLVFGVLSLAVPFFYVVLILAITMGTGLAILLHLSYKYKGMWLFSSVSKPDKFAILYTYFDGNLQKSYVKNRCKFRGLDKFQTDIIVDYTAGQKISYMAHCRHYSQRAMIYKLNEAIDKLINQ